MNLMVYDKYIPLRYRKSETAATPTRYRSPPSAHGHGTVLKIKR